MFEIFLRKTIMNGNCREEQEHKMLLKDKIKMQFLGYFLVYIFGILPLVSFLTLLIIGEHTLSNTMQCVSLILGYYIFLNWFKNRFKNQIKTFKHLIVLSLYTSRYVIKGNALSKDDFETIQKENENLYAVIMMQECQGYCYSVSFRLLECLKKGSILFVAAKCLQEEKEENNNKEYTMHALYVNNDWCFDTYSQRQYPLDEVLKRIRAKTFKSFTYNEIAGKTYEQFRAEQIGALKIWCQENNCYQEFVKED